MKLGFLDLMASTQPKKPSFCVTPLSNFVRFHLMIFGLQRKKGDLCCERVSEGLRKGGRELLRHAKGRRQWPQNQGENG